MHHLANSNNKTEFIFWMNILIAMHQKIYHLIINDKKKALMQLKYKKNTLKFYAVFEHLGEIEGILFNDNLKLFCEFNSTISLINLYKNELPFIVEVNKKEIDSLYEFSENLINLKA
jgi:ERCC4-type nuclease